MTARPGRVFLLVGSILGLVFVFLTPPFQVPDEPMHFYRAFQVSELRLLDLVALNAAPARGWFHYGALLPSSLAAAVDTSEVAATQFRPENKVDPAKLLAGLRAPLNPGDREYLPVAPYSPLAYVPQAVGIGLGRLFGLSPLVLLYLGRLCALGAWLTLVFLAIETAPFLKWTYVLLALMPMTLTLAASSSPDSVVIGVSFLLSAQLLSWAYDARRERVGPTSVVGLLALALVLTLSKAPYLALVALFFLVPPARFPSRSRYVLTFIVVVAACVGALAAWSLLTARVTVPGPTIDLLRHAADTTPMDGVSPGGQLAFIRAHPAAFARVLATTVAALGVFYLHAFVGILGWLDTLLPSWVPYGYLAVLVAASLLDEFPGRVSWKAKGLAFSLFALMTLALHAFFYVTMSRVGMKVVIGFQGRYMIPIAPLLFLLFLTRGLRWRVTTATAAALIGFVTLTTAVAGYSVVKRFYMAGVATPGPETLAPKLRKLWY